MNYKNVEEFQQYFYVHIKIASFLYDNVSVGVIIAYMKDYNCFYLKRLDKGWKITSNNEDNYYDINATNVVDYLLPLYKPTKVYKPHKPYKVYKPIVKEYTPNSIYFGEERFYFME